MYHSAIATSIVDGYEAKARPSRGQAAAHRSPAGLDQVTQAQPSQYALTFGWNRPRTSISSCAGSRGRSTYTSIPSAGTGRKPGRSSRSVAASRTVIAPPQQRRALDQTKSLPPCSRTNSTAAGEATTSTMHSVRQVKQGLAAMSFDPAGGLQVVSGEGGQTTSKIGRIDTTKTNHREERHEPSADRFHDGMAGSAGRASCQGKGSHPGTRRARRRAAQAALGPDRQGLRFRRTGR